jgi:hypothetical protein
MRRDRLGAETFAQMFRQTLGQPSRVDEDQRRLVGGDQFRQPVVVLLPDLVRHDGLEVRARNLHGEVHLATMALVDDGAGFADHEGPRRIFRSPRRTFRSRCGVT